MTIESTRRRRRRSLSTTHRQPDIVAIDTGPAGFTDTIYDADGAHGAVGTMIDDTGQVAGAISIS